MPQFIQKAGSHVRSKVQAFCYWLGPMYCILLGAFVLFGSFIVQLLTSIGVPYIKAFDFFRFDMSDATFVELGMWAACTGRQAFIIPTMPSANQPEQFNCPPASWGWKTSQYSTITNTFFHHNLPKALILHPISCVFTFLAMTAALVTIKRKRQHIALPIFSFLSCLFAFLSFVIDVATFVPAQSKLMTPKAAAILGQIVTSTELGPAFWLSITCFVLDIAGNSIIIAGYGIWRYQRISREQRTRSGAYAAEDIELKAGSRLSGRRYFANESTASLGNLPYSDDAEKGEARSSHEESDVVVNVVPREAGQTQGRASFSSQPRRSTSSSHAGSDERKDTATPVVEGSRFTEDIYEEVDDDGYDSAVTNYDDARSEVARRSRDASRSQVNVAVSRSDSTARPQSPRNVRRKPVEQL